MIGHALNSEHHILLIGIINIVLNHAFLGQAGQ